MSVKIRLRKMGKRNAVCHRIVVTDSRNPRDGRFIEILGTYDPRAKREQIDLERADYWLSNGAQPSETVAAIIKRSRAGMPLGAAKTAEEGEPEEPEADVVTAEETEVAEAEAAEAEPEAEAPEVETAEADEQEESKDE